MANKITKKTVKTKALAKAKKKMGRPLIEFKDEYVDLLVGRMREGQAVATVCREIGVSHQTFDSWVRKYPDFSTAYSLAKTFCKGWWCEKARENLGQRGFQSTLWLMNMRNRFGWQEGKPHFPFVELQGFKQPSLKAKAEACAIALADKRISADHYAVLMSGLLAHAQIIDKSDTAERLEKLEAYIKGERDDTVAFPSESQKEAVA